MRRAFYKPYLLVFGSIFLLLSIPKGAVQSIRGTTFSILAPFWGTMTPRAGDSTVEQLQLENHLLRGKLQQFYGLLSRKQPNVQDRLTIPARVIFRTPSSWNSSLWIDVGSENNTQLPHAILAKNSPVVVGKSIVGLVDYVGKHQSRVRLITDSGLSPSVRAVRGKAQHGRIGSEIDHFRHLVENQKGLFSQDTLNQLLEKLDQTKNELAEQQQTWYLAKGELHGSSEPLWRSSSSTLQGIGFNYDFPDDKGPARNLRTGRPNNDPSASAIPLIKTHDILVTTGMDGVFPPDLLVGEVTKVYPLKEGDYFYQLEAEPTAGNLDDLSLVFVMAPIDFNKEDLPPMIGR